MRNICFFLIFMFCQCSIHVDRNQINNEYFKLISYSNYNILNYHSLINYKADKEIYQGQHFEIKIPKKIKSINILNNNFFIEYDSKQLICISPGYNNEVSKNEWKTKSVEELNISDILFTYWKQKGYNPNYIDKTHDKRITKLYSDGKASILLYNIKENDFDRYLTLIREFKYIE